MKNANIYTMVVLATYYRLYCNDYWCDFITRNLHCDLYFYHNYCFGYIIGCCRNYFWIRYARKPKPQQSITQKILTRTPGVAEMYYAGERTGVNKAVAGGASAIYNTSKNVG